MGWDETLLRIINSFAGESDALDWLALTISSSRSLWVPGTLLAGYWLWLCRREMLIAAPVLGGLIGLLDFLGARLKDVVARPRPCMIFSDIQQLQACGKTFSFPSNHAINTATAAAFVQVLYPKSGWISWPLVFFVGLARVYIGAHYVTDVIGGWVLGGVCGAGAAWFLLQWPRYRDVKQTLLNDGRK